MTQSNEIVESFLRHGNVALREATYDRRIEKQKIILVEGLHEVQVFDAWLKQLGCNDVQTVDYSGKDNLAPFFAGFVRQQSFETITHLLVVRDANANALSAFQSVCDALTTRQRGSKFKAPSSAWKWTAQDTGTPSLAIAILPGDGKAGALEELLLATASDDLLFASAQRFVDDACAELERKGSPRNPPPGHKRGKARIHAYLATWDSPDMHSGIASRKGVWNWGHPALQDLRNLLLGMQ